jgi:hypothetical protein
LLVVLVQVIGFGIVSGGIMCGFNHMWIGLIPH